MKQMELIKPSPAYGAQIMAFRTEVMQAGDPDAFAGCESLGRCQSAEEWLRHLACHERKETCPAGEVPFLVHLAIRQSDGRLVGIIDLRPRLDNPVLRLWGGHMGYTVRPSERKRGYACEMVRQNLQNCRKLGLKRVLITCSETNAASERVIRANGGIYERTVDADGERVRRYWIPLCGDNPEDR